MARSRPGAPPDVDDPLTEELRRNFGENLRAARVAARMTQAQLSRRTGLTQQYVSLVEIGRKNLTLSTMAQLAHVFGFDVIAMLGRAPSEPPETDTSA
jgi:transcriptional regulator with XRE-family HTH domain